MKMFINPYLSPLDNVHDAFIVDNYNSISVLDDTLHIQTKKLFDTSSVSSCSRTHNVVMPKNDKNYDYAVD